MNKSHRRHPLAILAVCIIAALASSCTPKTFRGMAKEGKQSITVSQLYPFVTTDGEASNYSIDIDFRGNAMSGLLSVQPDYSNKSTRIVCNSVFGFSLFDFDLTPSGLKIYECAEQMRNKHLLRVLEKDFRIVFFQNFESDTFEGKVYSLAKNNTKGYLIKNKYGDFRYVTDEASASLKLIESEGKITKSDIAFTYTADKQLDSVVINHPVLRAKATIKRLAE